MNFYVGIALGFVLGAGSAVGYLLIAFARDCWRQGRME